MGGRANVVLGYVVQTSMCDFLSKLCRPACVCVIEVDGADAKQLLFRRADVYQMISRSALGKVWWKQVQQAGEGQVG